MKKHILEFIRRGLTAFGFGPIVLAVIYLVLHWQGVLETLRATEVCLGIFTLSALAFIAGGMSHLYHIEKLPLMAAIFIHGIVLYIGYLITYLINNWLERGTTPILVFTGIFVLAYLVIWVVIYSVIKQKANKLNEVLKSKQQNE